MSLAGAQPKIPISGQFNAAGELIAFEPVNGLVSTYIIKPPRSDTAFPALVLNEYLCMTAAANSGLDIPEVRLINYMNSHGESPVEDTAFVIKRFDRVVYSDKPDGTPFSFINTEKVHQEDLCQSVGHSPSKKYEYEDGHRVGAGMAELFDIVSEICDTPAKDKQELLYRIFFNFIIGNDDAHSKNFSFLHTGKKLKLSPAYDIVSTQAYENLTSRDYQLQHTMAMAIGTARETSKLTPEDLSIFEAHCKIRLKPIKRKLLAFIDRAMSEVEKATKLVIESHAFLESEKRLLNRIHEVSDANGKVLRKAVYHYTNS
jgi:serine/threonine-protein kinase HipA